jgi:16S rRNA A1518/A1519 N6-dimethyltransferase RsmA/KsgA/DIM1 with predicted DNA glycosylase/AP lyase activity
MSETSKITETEVPDIEKPQVFTPRPEADSGVHNLETHDLTAREQLMHQWPSWDWERRDES